jgi:hypothetical protein
MARYHPSEKCSHLVKREELKMNKAKVRSGRWRKAKNATA